MPGVIILDRCHIGDNSIIHAGTVIGSDGFGYQVSQTGMKKIPQIGIVDIGKYVEIGANCSIDRAAFDVTQIGNGVKMDNGCHIAHNVIIGDHTAILAQTGIAGGVKIGMGCMIGGQVAIKDHVVIGDGVKVVSKSGVLTDVSNGQTVAGIPAIPFSQWKRTVVILGKLPEYIKTMQGLTKKRSIWAHIKALFGAKQ
jgi:UDP-3-O-[3-hydroxymyristoyl] glucosamine N-acyltransferase